MIVDTINSDTGLLEQSSLILINDEASHLTLAPAPGASAIQIVVKEDGKVLSSIEVQAQAGDPVSVDIRRDFSGAIRVSPQNRNFLTLPNDESPLPLLLRPANGKDLDIAILVDGTCLHPNEGNDLDYLLAPPLAGKWSELVQNLASFVTTLAGSYPNAWMTALAFGDQPMPLVANPILAPKYVLYPASRRFAPPDSHQIGEQVSAQLRKLPDSPGGDFVDALAEGLRACRDLMWRQSSRKLVLLFGQSPGYSILKPFDETTNLIARTLCVEEEVAALHQKGIEVVTVFHHSSEAEERYRVHMPQLFEQSREQYRTLASLPQWSVSSQPKDIERLAAEWLKPPVAIARGASPGLLLTQ